MKCRHVGRFYAKARGPPMSVHSGPPVKQHGRNLPGGGSVRQYYREEKHSSGTLSINSGPAVKQHGRNLLFFFFRTTVL